MNMKNLFLLLILAISLPDTASAQKFLDKVLKGVEKTNKILDETDKILGNDNSSTSSSRRKQASGFQIVSPHPDIDVQVTRSIAAGKTVIIDFILTNHAQDTYIDLGDRNSIAYDDLGNQFPSFGAAAGTDPDWKKKMLYPTDVPVKGRMWIENVKEEATVFKRINLVAYCPDLGMTYQNPIMFYNLPITRKDNSATLPPSESETSANQTSTGTLEIDEDFDTFEEKFVATSRFQMLRIKFENLGYNGEGEKWTQENWSIFKNKPSSMQSSGEYKYEQKLSADQCIQRIWIPDSEFTLEYTYSKINGKWYLVKAFERF